MHAKLTGTQTVVVNASLKLSLHEKNVEVIFTATCLVILCESTYLENIKITFHFEIMDH